MLPIPKTSMVRSYSSYYDDGSRESLQDEEDEVETGENDIQRSRTVPQSPVFSRSRRRTRPSEVDLTASRVTIDETSSLLGHRDGMFRSYTSAPGTPRPPFPYRQTSYKAPGSFKAPRHHSRRGSWSMRLVNRLDEEQRVSTGTAFAD